MTACQWSEATHLFGYKTVDMRFLHGMLARTDRGVDGRGFCNDDHHVWDQRYLCDRPAGHTGRHLALEWGCRYPVAVWR